MVSKKKRPNQQKSFGNLTPEYLRYINSYRWKAKREQKLAQAGRRCAVCLSRSNLKVHHMTYDRFGKELMSDLVVLCNPHHVAVHSFHRKTRGRLWDATQIFLKKKGKV